jgi:hypothetical protein
MYVYTFTVLKVEWNEIELCHFFLLIFASIGKAIAWWKIHVVRMSVSMEWQMHIRFCQTGFNLLT